MTTRGDWRPEPLQQPIAMFRKILCPIDLAPSSAGVLKAARTMARAFGAEVWVLHVNNAIGPRGRVLPPWSSRVLESPQRERLVSEVRRLMRQAGAGSRESVAVRHGEPVREIVRYARSLRPDLVVMGLPASGRALHSPSTTEIVAGFVPSAVLCVPPGENGAVRDRPPASVLCATGLSTTSRGAADLAMALARGLGARLTLLHVLSPERIARGPGALAAARTAESRLRDLWPADLTSPADIEYLVTPGAVDETIADVAERCGADLVVTGRREGCAPLNPIVREVIRQSRVPVLVAGTNPSWLPIDERDAWTRSDMVHLPAALSAATAREEAFR